MNCWNGWDEEIGKSNFFENVQKGRQKDVRKNRNIVDMLYNIFSDRQGRTLESLSILGPYEKQTMGTHSNRKTY